MSISSPIVPPKLGELGRIRMGAKKVSAKGKEYPAALDCWRLTSPSLELLERAQGLYGGSDPAPWVAGNGESQWEVFTDSNVLLVVVPLTGQAFRQSFEAWRRKEGGMPLCARRCDGEWDTQRDAACVCHPFDDRPAELGPKDEPCKLVTRLNVLMPDLGGGGVWRLETGSEIAASEIGGIALLLQRLAEAGVVSIPARLVLHKEDRRKPLPDGTVEVKQFVVPKLIPLGLEQFAPMLSAPMVRNPELQAPGMRELSAPHQSTPATAAPPREGAAGPLSGASRVGVGTQSAASAPDGDRVPSGRVQDSTHAPVGGRQGQESRTSAAGSTPEAPPAPAPPAEDGVSGSTAAQASAAGRGAGVDRPGSRPDDPVPPSPSLEAYREGLAALGLSGSRAAAMLTEHGVLISDRWWLDVESWDEDHVAMVLTDLETWMAERQAEAKGRAS